MTNSQSHHLDSLFQEVGLQRWKGKSIISGSPATVVHHFYGRRNKATRWYLPNAIPLTHEEHMRLHSEETELMENIIISKLGTIWFEELRKTAQRTAKYFTYEEVLAHLQGKTEHYLKNWYV
jgi:hypothetical protein